jgi:hypothetical protein
MGIFLFEPDYLLNRLSDQAENLSEGAGWDAASNFSVRLSCCLKWGVGGSVCPHCDFSETANSKFFKLDGSVETVMTHLLWKFNQNVRSRFWENRKNLIFRGSILDGLQYHCQRRCRQARGVRLFKTSFLVVSMVTRWFAVEVLAQLMPKVGIAVNFVVLWPSLLLRIKQLVSLVRRRSIGHGL